jgi:hypothetical protein
MYDSIQVSPRVQTRTECNTELGCFGLFPGQHHALYSLTALNERMQGTDRRSVSVDTTLQVYIKFGTGVLHKNLCIELNFVSCDFKITPNLH